MMNINNKSWEKLRATDIVKFLSDIEESIFVEFKSDDEAPNKLVKPANKKSSPKQDLTKENIAGSR